MSSPEPDRARIPVSSPRNNRESVMQRVSDDIIFGILKPGQRVSPETVSRECGISHIPVREALGELEGRGYLVRINNRGYFVPELSLDELEDIYLLRRELEEVANRLAIGRLTPADLKRMSVLVRLMRDARREGRWREHSYYNRDFHFVPFEAAGSPKLMDFLAHLWDMAARYQVPHFQDEGRAGTVGKQHRELLKAYKARDLKLVNSIMDEHREVTLTTYRDHFLVANGNR
jgi:DNA-binding GntR family transcriptional regulator